MAVHCNTYEPESIHSIALSKESFGSYKALKREASSLQKISVHGCSIGGRFNPFVPGSWGTRMVLIFFEGVPLVGVLALLFLGDGDLLLGFRLGASEQENREW